MSKRLNLSTKAKINSEKKLPIDGIGIRNIAEPSAPPNYIYLDETVNLTIQGGGILGGGAGTIAGIGAPVTREAGTLMILDYWDKIDDDSQIGAILFGKEAILQLFAQKGCEGIRFYICKNQEGEISLIAVGADMDGRDLNFTKYLTNPGGDGSLAIEIGSGKSIQELKDSLSKDDSNLKTTFLALDKDGEFLPPNN